MRNEPHKPDHRSIGQLAHEAYVEAMAAQGAGVDPWNTLEENEQIAWEAMAEDTMQRGVVRAVEDGIVSKNDDD